MALCFTGKRILVELSLSLPEPFQTTLHGEPGTRFESIKAHALLADLTAQVSELPPDTILAGLSWSNRPDQTAPLADVKGLTTLTGRIDTGREGWDSQEDRRV